MAKKLFSDGAGKVAIYDPANPNAFTNPRGNLQSVYFHSDLDYVAVAKEMNFSITHPARSVGGNGAYYSYPQPSFPAGEISPLQHNLGYRPFAICFINGVQLPANTQIQAAGMSYRTVSLVVDSNRVAIHETSWIYGSALAQLTVNYRVFLFTPPLAAQGNKVLHVTPDRFVASRGKLDSNRSYLRRNPSAPSLFLSKGRTADTSNGSWRIITAAGQVIERPPYNGGFSAAPGIGVET